MSNLLFFQFFTYNPASQICGLRNFGPSARAFSFGNLSGLKNEPLADWTAVQNSVYVGRLISKQTCGECKKACNFDPQCTSIIHNRVFSQCSFNFGTGPTNIISLPLNFASYGISTSFRCPEITEITDINGPGR